MVVVPGILEVTVVVEITVLLAGGQPAGTVYSGLLVDRPLLVGSQAAHSGLMST